jgi:hypothetical protein
MRAWLKWWVRGGISPLCGYAATLASERGVVGGFDMGKKSEEDIGRFLVVICIQFQFCRRRGRGVTKGADGEGPGTLTLEFSRFGTGGERLTSDFTSWIELLLNLPRSILYDADGLRATYISLILLHVACRPQHLLTSLFSSDVQRHLLGALSSLPGQFAFCNFWII